MRILYVTTVGVTMNFFYEEFKHLISQGHSLELACSSSWDYNEKIEALGLKRYELPFSRSPISSKNVNAYNQLKKLVSEKKYDIVHCHTPNAAAITRLACKKVRNEGTRVIYTAHGFHFFKGSPLLNWMLYYPVEKFCSRMTDVLITINKEDFELAKRRFRAKVIKYVPGVGIDTKKYRNLKVDTSEKRRALGIPEKATILLSVGELNKNKNHKTVINAIKGSNIYYLIAGKGELESDLKSLAEKNNLGKQVILLGYSNEVPELLSASDIFILPSLREGLSVSVMEAMASSKPVIVGKIRGNVDLIDNNGGALFKPSSIEGCRSALQRVLSSDMKKMGEYNRDKVKVFDTNSVISKIDEIYKSQLSEK